MQEWTEMFSSNPELGIMEQAYMKLKTQSECPNRSVLNQIPTNLFLRSKPSTSLETYETPDHGA